MHTPNEDECDDTNGETTKHIRVVENRNLELGIWSGVIYQWCARFNTESRM